MSKRMQCLAWILVASQANGETPAQSATWQPSIVAVSQTVAGQPGRLFTKLEMAENGDAKVTFEADDGSKKSAGKILVISGRWMLVNGLDLEEGREIDPLDIAALNTQLVLNLLSRALPAGPPASGENRTISMTEHNEPIEVGTNSASGMYAAPWIVKGHVGSLTDSTVSNYLLDFTFRHEHGDTTVRLEGFVSDPASGLEIPDSMSLAEWIVHRIGPYEEQTSDGTIFDYGARLAKVTAKTIGELRQAEAPDGRAP